MSPTINLKFLQHSDFVKIASTRQTDRWTDRRVQHVIAITDTRVLWPLGGAATMLARSLLVLRAVRRQRRAMYVILTTAER